MYEIIIRSLQDVTENAIEVKKHIPELLKKSEIKPFYLQSIY